MPENVIASSNQSLDRHYVAIIRHGEYHQKPDTPSAFQPYPLTEKGLKQAKDCGQKIGDYAEKLSSTIHPTLYTSSLLRAWQTADKLLAHVRDLSNANAQLSWNLHETPMLAERCVGSVANLSVTEIERILDQDPRYSAPPSGWKSNSDYCLPFVGAESLLTAGERVSRFIQDTIHKTISTDISALTKPKLFIFVGHGAAFRHAMFHLGILNKPQNR